VSIAKPRKSYVPLPTRAALLRWSVNTLRLVLEGSDEVRPPKEEENSSGGLILDTSESSTSCCPPRGGGEQSKAPESKKAELARGSSFGSSAIFLKTRRFPPPSHGGFGFFGSASFIGIY
jgi:hypothetical protein